MMTTVYLLRHSEPVKDLFESYNVNEDIEQIRNEKTILSVNGEKLAQNLSECEELQNIDVIYSSHYVRTMSTAKYIAYKNNILLNIDERFGERKFGVKDTSEIPEDFFYNQFRDWNYKLNDGESLNEVSKRTQNALANILNKHPNKRIVIVSHGTAITALMSRWCNIVLNEDTKMIERYFNNELIFNGSFGHLGLFKLEFDENNILKSIKNIK